MKDVTICQFINEIIKDLEISKSDKGTTKVDACELASNQLRTLHSEIVKDIQLNLKLEHNR